MIGFDARYNQGALQLTGQYIIANLSNTDQYNKVTGKDLGSKMIGYYAELGYNLLDKISEKQELIAFARYENYNTHAEVETDGGTVLNDEYNRTDITVGLGYEVAKGAMLKADYQFKSNAGSDEKSSQWNFGTAIWF